MIPILYSPDTTDFGENNGLGLLVDATECKVQEALNGEFELVMKYPASGIHFGEIEDRCIIYAKPSPSREPEPFRVYKHVRKIGETVEFSARHISYDLAGIPVAPFKTTIPAEAIGYMKSKEEYISSSFEYETDLYPTFSAEKTYKAKDYCLHNNGEKDIVYRCKEAITTPGAWDESKWVEVTNTMEVSAPTNARSLFGTGENTLLGSFGGQLKYEGYKVKLLVKRGEDKGVSLRYGTNLVDMNQEKNISEMYTHVLPYYADNSTDTTDIVTLANAAGHPEGSTALVSLGSFDHTYVFPLELSGQFGEKPSYNDLKAMSEKYIALNEYDKPKVSIDVKQAYLNAFQGAPAESIEIGDTVRVYYEKLGIEAESDVTETEYNVLTDRYNTIVVGEAPETIVLTIAKHDSAIRKSGGGGGGGGGGSSFSVAIFG